MIEVQNDGFTDRRKNHTPENIIQTHLAKRETK